MTEEPQQGPPGTIGAMHRKPDHGEDTYRGSGRLAGKATVSTGGHSGIGRAVAISFAREGADVLIAYLNAEMVEIRKTAPRSPAEPSALKALPSVLKKAIDAAIS